MNDRLKAIFGGAVAPICVPLAIGACFGGVILTIAGPACALGAGGFALATAANLTPLYVIGLTGAGVAAGLAITINVLDKAMNIFFDLPCVPFENSMKHHRLTTGVSATISTGAMVAAVEGTTGVFSKLVLALT